MLFVSWALMKSADEMYLETNYDGWGFEKRVPLEIPQDGERYWIGGSDEKADTTLWRDRIKAIVKELKKGGRRFMALFVKPDKDELVDAAAEPPRGKAMSIATEFAVESPLQPGLASPPPSEVAAIQPRYTSSVARPTDNKAISNADHDSIRSSEAHVSLADRKSIIKAKGHVKKKQQKEHATVPVTSYTLPCAYMSGEPFLRSFLLVADKTNSLDVFQVENVQVAVMAAWEQYGRKYHLIVCAIYVLFLALLTYSNYVYRGSSSDALMIIVMALNTVTSSTEMLQLIYEGPFTYFADYEVLPVICSNVFNT